MPDNSGQSLSSKDVISSVLHAACNQYRPALPKVDSSVIINDGKPPRNPVERLWIGSLHKAFANHYTKFTSITVLSKDRYDKAWRRNEFIYDVSVVERFEVRSAYKEKHLPVARRALWQVESEMSSSGRDVAIDFSKLVIGSSENKLLIVRRPAPGERRDTQIQNVCRFVGEMAAGCDGNLFLAFLPGYARAGKRAWGVDFELSPLLFVRTTQPSAEACEWSEVPVIRNNRISPD